MKRLVWILCLALLFVLQQGTDASAAVDKDCSDFIYHDDAQYYFTSHGGSSSFDFDNLDVDHDGVACELLPYRPASYLPADNVSGSTSSSKSNGISKGWILVLLAGSGFGAWYYFAEIYGDKNKRAPRPTGLPYDTAKMDYNAYLRTPEWAATRELALVRDGRKCTKCGGTNALQVHHLSYKRRGNEKRKDLQTLCRSCHDQRHRR